jgi:hypothetical protein
MSRARQTSHTQSSIHLTEKGMTLSEYTQQRAAMIPFVMRPSCIGRRHL